MRSLYLISIYLFVCLYCVNGACAEAFSSTPSTQSTSDLASRFRKYRQDLDNPSSANKVELRQWSGPLHTVMNLLGERLGSGHYTFDRVIGGEAVAIISILWSKEVR